MGLRAYPFKNPVPIGELAKIYLKTIKTKIMKLTTEELKKGEVYFISFGEALQKIVRIKEEWDGECMVFASTVQTYHNVETYWESSFTIDRDFTELRPATEAEKAKLEKYEAESNSNPVKEFVTTETADKYQQFFNFLNQEHGLVCTIEQMNEIMREAVELDKKLRE